MQAISVIFSKKFKFMVEIESENTYLEGNCKDLEAYFKSVYFNHH